MAKNQVENFRENLCAITTDLGYGAVSELARHFNVHRVTMSRKINGHEPFNLEEAQQIAEFYGYSLSDLLVAPKEFRKILASA